MPAVRTGARAPARWWLFVFDVNTVGQLRRLGDAPPWVTEVEGATITQEVEWLGDGQSIWHVHIDERFDGGRSSVHHEQIGELGVELATIADALAGDFVLLESCDDDDGAPTNESARAYFAYRARGADAASTTGARAAGH